MPIAPIQNGLFPGDSRIVRRANEGGKLMMRGDLHRRPVTSRRVLEGRDGGLPGAVMRLEKRIKEQPRTGGLGYSLEEQEILGEMDDFGVDD